MCIWLHARSCVARGWYIGVGQFHEQTHTQNMETVLIRFESFDLVKNMCQLHDAPLAIPTTAPHAEEEEKEESIRRNGHREDTSGRGPRPFPSAATCYYGRYKLYLSVAIAFCVGMPLDLAASPGHLATGDASKQITSMLPHTSDKHWPALLRIEALARADVSHMYTCMSA